MEQAGPADPPDPLTSDRTLDAVLACWIRSLERRDPGTRGHARRVANLAYRIGHRIGLDEGSLVHLRRGALLHDVGKVAIPERILRSTTPLTNADWRLVRRHPVVGYELVEPVPALRPCLPAIYHHHERWDGSGYPRGIEGTEIPEYARIVALADSWDAMRSRREKKERWSEERALTYVRRQAAGHFDPEVVEAFMELFTEGAILLESPPDPGESGVAPASVG